MSVASGFCLLHADGRVLAQGGEDRPFYAASTIKLAVMVAAARLVDAGQLGWDDGVVVHSSFRSGVAGAPAFTVPPEDRDERMPADGTTMTVRALVQAMIGRSSNEATNLLVERVGLPAVSRVLADADAIGCRMERLIGDTAARDAGLSNEVTPLGLARLMLRVVTGGLASPAGTAVMVETLRGQEFPVIAEVLPPGVAWGSKSGWVPGIEHDVAFLGVPGTAELRVLAVCTEGHPGRDGRTEIHRVARALLTDFADV
jgi:beta-lactamase class A